MTFENEEEYFSWYFTKVYVVFGTDIQSWFDTEDPNWHIDDDIDTHTFKSENNINHIQWLEHNNYITEHENYDNCNIKFTQKFIDEVINVR